MAEDQRPWAEDVGHYWRTSRSSPGTWLERAVALIEDAGGRVRRHMTAVEGARAAFVIEFELGADPFRIVWPVLASEGGDMQAARRQSATALYHAVKARVVEGKFLGARRAFFAFYALPDGRTAADLAGGELEQAIPLTVRQLRALPAGDAT